MPNRTYLILGPDGTDEVPMHWDRTFWQWVEGEAGNKPSPSCVYTGAELQIPFREYPLGAVGVGCLEDGQCLTFPPTGEGSENKI